MIRSASTSVGYVIQAEKQRPAFVGKERQTATRAAKQNAEPRCAARKVVDAEESNGRFEDDRQGTELAKMGLQTLGILNVELQDWRGRSGKVVRR